MALSKGVNSYATVTEADEYFNTRLDVAAWTLANDLTKASALVTATQILDAKSWGGFAPSAAQSLAFPRTLSYYEPKLGIIVALSSTVVPSRITEACFEIAYHLLNNDGVLDDVSEVESLKIGPIELKGIRSASSISSIASALIKPLLDPDAISSTNRWWRTG
jgi:hypothetical protein